MLSKQMATIYVVRHGQAVHNVDKIVVGVTDTPLTPSGEEQARVQAEKLTHVKFDAVFSSDLLRAKRTAEIIVIDRQLAINTTHLLRERNFGQWEGRTEEDFYRENAALLEKLKTLSEKEKQDFRLGEGYE